MAGWAIPMGSQVSVEAEQQRRYEETLARFREARAAVKGVDPLTAAVNRGLEQPGAKWTPETGWTDDPICCGDPSDCTERCA